jgi:hypothetical protein
MDDLESGVGLNDLYAAFSTGTPLPSILAFPRDNAPRWCNPWPPNSRAAYSLACQMRARAVGDDLSILSLATTAERVL